MILTSEACERNKDPILNILQDVFSKCEQVLELGSGTGQHAVYFAQNLPHLSWYASDVAEHLNGINHRIDEAQLPNLQKAFELNVQTSQWDFPQVDAIFTANTLHIMSWKEVQLSFSGFAKISQPHSTLCVYGPFKYKGEFTSASNDQFDHFLRQRDPQSGIRDFEEVDALAKEAGFTCLEDHAMPANNQCIVWKKS